MTSKTPGDLIVRAAAKIKAEAGKVVQRDDRKADVERAAAAAPEAPSQEAPAPASGTPAPAPQPPASAPAAAAPTAPAPAAPPVAGAPQPLPQHQSSTIELDLVHLQKLGILTPLNQRARIAEEYRIIKRPLLRAAFAAAQQHNAGHVCMITSAHANEGKTFTSINLAMSVASEQGLHVLLIDGDIRRRGLSELLGVTDRKGLMDALMNPTRPVSDVILRTNIPNLSVISSGQPIEASTEMFASQRMTTLVNDIANRYKDRFIIFDAPPVLASSEPGVLALHVGHVIMVVCANRTPKRDIAEALRLVDVAPNIHFILNRLSAVAGTSRFGYYGTDP